MGPARLAQSKSLQGDFQAMDLVAELVNTKWMSRLWTTAEYLLAKKTIWIVQDLHPLDTNSNYLFIVPFYAQYAERTVWSDERYWRVSEMPSYRACHQASRSLNVVNEFLPFNDILVDTHGTVTMCGKLVGYCTNGWRINIHRLGSTVRGPYLTDFSFVKATSGDPTMALRLATAFGMGASTAAFRSMIADVLLRNYDRACDLDVPYDLKMSIADHRHTEAYNA